MGGKVRSNKGSVFYVYALLDPRKPGPFRYSYWVFPYEPFYIGKGKNNRANDHILRPYEKSFKATLIRKLLRLKLTIPVKIIRANLTEQDALELECKLIPKIGRRGLNEGPLTNLTDGGDGLSNVEDSTRKKMSRSGKRKHKRILRQEPEKEEARRRKISESMKALYENNPDLRKAKSLEVKSRPKKCERKRIRSLRRSWRKLSPEERKKRSESVANARASRPQYLKDLEIERRRRTMLNRSPEEKQKSRILKQNSWQNKPEIEKQEHKEAIRKKAIERTSDRTKKEWDSIRDKFRATLNNRTKEEWDVIKAKISNTLKQRNRSKVYGN